MNFFQYSLLVSLSLSWLTFLFLSFINSCNLSFFISVCSVCLFSLKSKIISNLRYTLNGFVCDFFYHTFSQYFCTFVQNFYFTLMSILCWNAVYFDHSWGDGLRARLQERRRSMARHTYCKCAAYFL